MSEAKGGDEKGKKKGGKMPMILALVLVLGGGGFFMMKGKGDKHKPEPKVELAAKETELEEFLTNMADGTTYVRTKMAVRLIKEFNGKPYEEAAFTSSIGGVRDAINGVLRTTNPADIRTAEGLKKLKRTLAAAMNKILSEEAATDEESDKDKKKKKKKKSEESSESKKSKDEEDTSDEPEHPEWDSDTGPVLQVFFTNIATQ